LQPVRAVRSRGFAISLVIILSYYLMLSAADTLATQGRVPVAALWTPDVVLASIGVVLFIRQAHELTGGGENFFGRFAETTLSRVTTALRRAS
jgi:hypothetical protein